MMSDLISLPAMPQICADTSSEDFVRIFSELGPKLLQTLCGVLGNYADAQDASQDAFLKCWRARSSTTPVRDLPAWIFRVGINAARDTQCSAWRRRIRPLEATACWHTTTEDSPAEIAEQNEQLDLLRRAIMQLHLEERTVFLLRQNEQLTYDEIARLRNSPTGSVKTRMRRALAKLRVALRGMNGE
jgi:RNA polymerase sigma-70 factor, ECF subfamily